MTVHCNSYAMTFDCVYSQRLTTAYNKLNILKGVFFVIKICPIQGNHCDDLKNM